MPEIWHPPRHSAHRLSTCDIGINGYITTSGLEGARDFAKPIEGDIRRGKPII